MKSLNADKKFIEDWSAMAGKWGFSRSTSQVFALLLLKDRRMTYVEIMNELNISRGNVHSAIHKLVSLELAFKFQQSGDRKEYFTAESDLWKVFEIMMSQFKRRSLDVLIERISEIPYGSMQNNSGHLQNIRKNLKSILKVYIAFLGRLPKKKRRISSIYETWQNDYSVY